MGKRWVDEYTKPEFWIATDASDEGWGIVIYETGVKEWGEFRYPEASDIFVKEMFALRRGILRVIDGNTPMEICAHVDINMAVVAAARRGYTLVAKASHMLEFVMKKLEEAGSSLRVVYIPVEGKSC